MTKDRPQDAPPPFSRPLAVAAVPPEGLDLIIEPGEEECAALARENDLRALSSLEARLHVARSGAEGLEVSGVLRASIRQTCVVTLEDFDSTLEEPIHLRFAPPPRINEAKFPRRERAAPRKTAEDEEWEHAQIFGLDEDVPDPLIGGAIDLGAIVSEFLTLGLDPYPRKPGARFEEPAPPKPADSPFGILRQTPPAGKKPGE